MVIGIFIPIYVELLLRIVFPQLIITHILQFGSLLVHILMHKACCRGVIGLDRSSWLWMTKFLENVSDWNSNLGVINTPAVSASAEEDTTCLRALHLTRIAPLIVG